LKSVLAGGFGLGASAIGIAPGEREGLDPSLDLSRIGSRDSLQIMRTILRLGRRITFDRRAYAQSMDDGPAIILVKVTNMLNPNFFFKFGELVDDSPGSTNGAVTPYKGPTSSSVTGNFALRYDIPWAVRQNGDVSSGKVTSQEAQDYLVNQGGIDKVSSVPRWRQLRLNQWFSNLLETGTPEPTLGTSILSSTTYFPNGSEVAPFPDSVGFHAFPGVEQPDPTTVHSFRNCLVVQELVDGAGGDITYHLDAKKLVDSKLGLVCFNMGDLTRNMPGESANNVYRGTANKLLTSASSGQKVASYVRTIQQLVATGGHVDFDLALAFDRLGGEGDALRTQLKMNDVELQRLQTTFGIIGNMESQPPFANVTALAQKHVKQNTGDLNASSGAAASEFLAQCRFVKTALDIPGRPFRNFTLHLNVVDLNTTAPDETPQVVANVRAINVIEGMRQLAVGLNMLAQACAKSPNTFVVVVSDGGRTANFADATLSPAFVMGAGLKDWLFCDKSSFADPSDPYSVEMAEGRFQVSCGGNAKAGQAGIRPFSNDDRGGPVFVNEDGSDAYDPKATSGGFPTTASVMIGLIRHIESIVGVPSSTTAGFGQYVKMQPR
jgi:hypothetical protein